MFEYFQNIPELGITMPSEIAVVGDRLLTDIMMANMMGALSVWVKDGTLEDNRLVGNIGACRFQDYADSCIVFANRERSAFVPFGERLQSIRAVSETPRCLPSTAATCEVNAFNSLVNNKMISPLPDILRLPEIRCHLWKSL